MLPVVVPELRLLPALHIEQMAFLESGGIVNDGHQEVAAQDFLGTFQDEVGVAVAQNGRDRALDGRGAHHPESGLLPGQQIAGHRHAPGLEKMQDPLQGLAPGLVRRASEPGRQERRDRRVEDISQGRQEVQVPKEVLRIGANQIFQGFQVLAGGTGRGHSRHLVLQGGGSLGRQGR